MTDKNIDIFSPMIGLIDNLESAFAPLFDPSSRSFESRLESLEFRLDMARLTEDYEIIDELQAELDLLIQEFLSA